MKPTINTKGRNLRSRLLFFVLTSHIIISAFVIYNEYSNTLKITRKSTYTRLTTITQTAAAAISAYDVKYIKEKYPNMDDILSNNQDSVYSRVSRILANIKDNSELSTDLYILTLSDSLDQFEFIFTSAQSPYYRHKYTTYPKELKLNYSVGGFLDTYKDSHGNWISAFTPIKDSNGITLGVIQADYDLAEYLNMLNESIVQSLILVIFIIVITGIFIGRHIYLLSKRQVEYEDSIIERNEELIFQTHQIALQNSTILKQRNELEQTKEELKASLEQIELVNFHLNEKVFEQGQEIVNVNEELGDFLYHSSHDLQAPLASAKGLLDIMEYELEGKESQLHLGLLKSTMERLTRMVKAIQAIYTAKNSDSILEEINIKNLIDSAAKPIIEGMEIIFNNFIPDNIAMYSDEKLWKILFEELIRNSIQYRRKEILIIEIGIKSFNRECIDIYIKDNGQGIDKVESHKIFELFNRSNQNSQGAGLGLNIVVACLNRLNSTIRHVEQSEGTEFHIKVMSTPIFSNMRNQTDEKTSLDYYYLSSNSAPFTSLIN